MNTDQIVEALGKKAVARERDAITRAANEYNKALGLQGVVEEIKIAGKDGKEVRIYTSDIYTQIRDQLIAKRQERIIANEVQNFMTSVEAFSTHIAGLSQYIESQS